MSEMQRPFPTQPESLGPSRLSPGFTQVRSTGASYAKSNNVKYRDRGVKPAKGRAGSASMEVRALLGSDGATVISASTGRFDGAPGTGVIEKMQLKVLNTGLSTVNEKPRDNEWSYTIQGLGPNDQIQLQANIRGFDATRTDVVTVRLGVSRRPELAVSAINGAAQAYSNSPVTFSAPVRELNGDVGARADCVLSVDGSPVDQATGIWIDAGDVVSCQFTHMFTTTGPHTVAISATNVDPGDWDLSNNSSSMPITILTPGNPITFGSIQVGDEAYLYTFESLRTGAYPIQGLYRGQQNVSYLNFYGTTVNVAGPLQRVDARVSTNGSEVYASSLTRMFSYRYDDGFAVSDCTDYIVNGEQAQSCVARNHSTGNTSAWFFYAHSSGTATYYGQTLYCHTRGCDTYTTNDNDVTGWGARYGLSAGSVVRVELTFVDAAGVSHIVDRGVTLDDHSAAENYDLSTCFAYFDRLGQVCQRRTSVGTVWSGVTSWENLPVTP